MTRFDRSGIESLLRELAQELDQRGAQADLFLVGGAAMALGYDAAGQPETSTPSSHPPRWCVPQRPRSPRSMTLSPTG